MTSSPSRVQKPESPFTGPPAFNTRFASSQRASQEVHHSPAPSPPNESGLQIPTLQPNSTPIHVQPTHVQPPFLPLHQQVMGTSNFQLPRPPDFYINNKSMIYIINITS